MNSLKNSDAFVNIEKHGGMAPEYIDGHGKDDGGVVLRRDCWQSLEIAQLWENTEHQYIINALAQSTHPDHHTTSHKIIIKQSLRSNKIYWCHTIFTNSKPTNKWIKWTNKHMCWALTLHEWHFRFHPDVFLNFTCRALGLSAITSAASLKARDAFCSPSAAITWKPFPSWK